MLAVYSSISNPLLKPLAPAKYKCWENRDLPSAAITATNSNLKNAPPAHHHHHQHHHYHSKKGGIELWLNSLGEEAVGVNGICFNTAP